MDEKHKRRCSRARNGFVRTYDTSLVVRNNLEGNSWSKHERLVPVQSVNAIKELSDKVDALEMKNCNKTCTERRIGGRIMSKARELAELGAVYDSGALSNRNLVINGGMQCPSKRNVKHWFSCFIIPIKL